MAAVVPVPPAATKRRGPAFAPNWPPPPRAAKVPPAPPAMTTGERATSTAATIIRKRIGRDARAPHHRYYGNNDHDSAQHKFLHGIRFLLWRDLGVEIAQNRRRRLGYLFAA